MQKIILFLILSTFLSLFAVPIDKSFFEGENVLAYYAQVEKDINNSINQKLKDPKTIELERSTLEKLKLLYQHKGDIKPFPTITPEKNRLSQEEYLKALFLLADLANEIERLQKKEKNFQKKLFELKATIEKELSQTQKNNLLVNQMQYAFYKISQEKITKTLSLYSTLYDKELQKLQQTLRYVKFSKTKQIKKIIKTIEKRIDTLQNQDLLLNIEKDSEIPRSHKEEKKILQQEKKLQKDTQKNLTVRLKNLILQALKAIQQKEQKSFLEIMDTIDTDINKLSSAHKERFLSIAKILLTIGENAFDTTSVAIASTQIGFSNILDSLHKFITKTLFVYEEKAFSIQTVLIFSFILFIGFFIAKLYKNFIDSFRRTQRIKSLSTARMVANSGYYIIILTTFFIALKTIGLDMHTIFLIIGAIMLWIAFGLQSFISNYAIGILLKIDRSIRIGDHIELDPTTVGDVDDMDFRSVTILSSDNIRTTIPNSRFISDTFINHSLEGEARRLHIAFSANKIIPHRIIEEKILTALSQSDLPHFQAGSYRPQVAITDINRKIVRYALLVWVKKEITYDMTLAQSLFLKLIHQTLYPEPKS